MTLPSQAAEANAAAWGARGDLQWQPIETAPKNHPIWVYYDHDADPHYIETLVDGRQILSVYAAHAEGLSCKTGQGQCAAVWGLVRSSGGR